MIPVAQMASQRDPYMCIVSGTAPCNLQRIDFSPQTHTILLACPFIGCAPSRDKVCESKRSTGMVSKIPCTTFYVIHNDLCVLFYGSEKVCFFSWTLFIGLRTQSGYFIVKTMYCCAELRHEYGKFVLRGSVCQKFQFRESS